MRNEGGRGRGRKDKKDIKAISPRSFHIKNTLSFIETLAMWVSHVRNSSISTSMHLLQLTLFIAIPFTST